MNREKNLQEMVVSIIAGAFISAVLCNVLPCIETGFSGMVLYMIFWFTATVLVWGAIDIAERFEQ